MQAQPGLESLVFMHTMQTIRFLSYHSILLLCFYNITKYVMTCWGEWVNLLQTLRIIIIIIIIIIIVQHASIKVLKY